MIFAPIYPMRLAFLVLLLACVAYADNVTIKRSLALEMNASCPGNILSVDAVASDGSPAPDVELRLVLYYPYQGLRALKHTDVYGKTFFELTKNGTYRVYINTDAYNAPQYIAFEYPALCPPPPPKTFEVKAAADCADNLTVISASAGGMPLANVTVTSERWSSVTGASGTVEFPLEEGYVFVSAKAPGYGTRESYFYITCAPPPECEGDADCGESQYCSGGSCMNLTGGCGFAENHTWFVFECCEDAECGSGQECENNTCSAIPAPPKQNITANETKNTTGETSDQGPESACPLPLILLISLLIMKR